MANRFGGARRPSKRYDINLGILSLFLIEFQAKRPDGAIRFYCANVRAREYDEALHILKMHLHEKDYSLHMLVDTESLGKDNSWMRQNRNYRIDVVSMKMHCATTYYANKEVTTA